MPQMLCNNARRLPRLVSEGPCSLYLGPSDEGLKLRIRLPEIFVAALPRRLIHAKCRLNKFRTAELTAVNLNSGSGKLGAIWLELSGQNRTAARVAFMQLRAYIFKPIPVNEAPKLRGLSADLITQVTSLPTLRIPCKQHGKRYAISGWKVSEFPEPAAAATLVKALLHRQSGPKDLRPSGQGDAENA